MMARDEGGWGLFVGVFIIAVVIASCDTRTHYPPDLSDNEICQSPSATDIC